MKNHWLTLGIDTFLWTQEEEGLIYQSENHAQIRFQNTGIIKELTATLNKPESLYRVLLTEEMLQQTAVKQWTDCIIENTCGRLVPEEEYPVSLKPILKLQDGKEHYQWEHKQGIDGDVIHNLHKLIFYINGSEYGNELYRKQTLYPGREKATLKLEKIYWFVKNATAAPFLNEVALIGNLYEISEIETCIDQLDKIVPIRLYTTLQDALKHCLQAKKWHERKLLTLLVTDYEPLHQFLHANEWSRDLSYHLFVTSETEYETATNYIEQYGLQQADIIPVYTQENLKFFEECLFIDDETLKETTISKREIFAKQALNIFNFGKLYITPNGNVYANLQDKTLGTINDTPHHLTYQEITEGDSWLRIRDQKPCCNCVYQWLCPSPSEYERLIGKSNLCHIRK